MYKITEENIRLVIKVCSMYYYDGLSQDEIAKKIGFSRSQICKILLAAKEDGIVSFTIKNPFYNSSSVEERLMQLFNLDSATVVDSTTDNFETVSHDIAETCTKVFKAHIHDGEIIGVSSGLSINYVAENVGDIGKKNLKLVPLIGGSVTISSWDSNATVQTFSKRWGGYPYSLYAPGFVQSVSIKEHIISEPNVAYILGMMKNCDTAIVGIGSISQQSSVVRSNYISDDDYLELQNLKAQAGICNSFFDADGNVVDFSGTPRMIGIDIEDFKKIPKRFGVLYGSHKAAAVLAVLNGGWINHLVIDEKTAEIVVNLKETSMS